MLLGIDAGPQQTLASLQLEKVAQIEAANSDSQHPEYWAQLARDCEVDAVVLGTSRSERGSKAEQACLRAACDMRLAVIVVEDMPGNYLPVRDLVPDLVVVESAPVANYVRQRTDGPKPAAIISGASVRYDPLRLQAMQGERIEIKNHSRHLVWLGQPETQANLFSLERLLPHVSSMGLEMLFKAHPRDDGYRKGLYQRLFATYKRGFLDVSDCETKILISYPPRLALTHFSSMAIELAFMGTPCCNVLFPESGGRIYREMTGLHRPFLCEVGGSGTISGEVSIKRELERLLFDMVARKAQMACFDEYFDIANLQQPRVASAIDSLVLSKQKNR